MRYMRCQCGKAEAWTSMGHPACDGCSTCQTTLEEGPTEHRAPEPHEWVTEFRIDRITGATWRERVCVRCFRKERVE